MSTDSVDNDGTDNADIMAAVDLSDGEAIFIIADVSREHAWISTNVSDVVYLRNWQ